MWLSTMAYSWSSYHPTLFPSILLGSFSPLRGGECMSIRLKVRGPWTCNKRCVWQCYRSGKGMVATYTLFIPSMYHKGEYMLRCRWDAQPDIQQHMDGQEGEECDQQRCVVCGGRGEDSVQWSLVRFLYWQHCISLSFFCVCVYIAVYYAVFFFFLWKLIYVWIIVKWVYSYYFISNMRAMCDVRTDIM